MGSVTQKETKNIIYTIIKYVLRPSLCKFLFCIRQKHDYISAEGLFKSQIVVLIILSELTVSSLMINRDTIANGADLDKMANEPSHQDLHCFFLICYWFPIRKNECVNIQRWVSNVDSSIFKTAQNHCSK